MFGPRERESAVVNAVFSVVLARGPKWAEHHRSMTNCVVAILFLLLVFASCSEIEVTSQIGCIQWCFSHLIGSV